MGIKRPRPTRVCGFCKARKIKCNREQPCSNCIRYNSQKCEYEFPRPPPPSTSASSLSQPAAELHRPVPGSAGSVDLFPRANDGVDVGFGGPYNPPFKPDDDLPKHPPQYDCPEPYDEVDYSKQSPSMEAFAYPSNSNHDKFVSKNKYFTRVLNVLKNYYYDTSVEDDESDAELNFIEIHDSLPSLDDSNDPSYGPLSGSSMIKFDPTLTFMWTQIKNDIRERKFRSIDTTSLQDSASPTLRPPSIAATPHDPISDVSSSPPALSPAATLRDFGMGSNSNITEVIKDYIPKKKVLWLLLERFFKYMYPFMPIVDEKDLRSELTLILGPESYEDEPIEEFNVSSYLDLAKVGSLLLILRIAFLSYFSNNRKDNEDNILHPPDSPDYKEFTYLLNHPISADTYDIASSCLGRFDWTSSHDISVLQLVIFIRIYQMYGPEYGDATSFSNPEFHNSMMVQLAYSLGIHREPRPAQNPDEERHNHLRRKLWYVVISLASASSSLVGNVFTFPGINCNVKMPYLTHNNSNNYDIRIEALGVKILERSPRATRLMNDLFLKMFDEHKDISIHEVDRGMDFYFDKIIEMIPSADFDEESNGEYPSMFIATGMMHSIYKLTYVQLTLYFNYFNQFLRLGKINKANKYLEEILRIIYQNVLPLLRENFSTEKIKYQCFRDNFIAPSLQFLMHKSGLVLTAIILRVKTVISGLSPSSPDEETNEFHGMLTRFEQTLRNAMYILIQCSKYLSDRYYYAWRISKSLEHFLYCCDAFDTTPLRQSAGYNVAFGFNIRSLSEFSQMMDIFMSHLETHNFTHITGDELEMRYDVFWYRVLRFRNSQKSHQLLKKHQEEEELPENMEQLYWRIIEGIFGSRHHYA